MDRADGFIAASDGLPRDETKSPEWLEGYDGWAIGVAETARRKAELDAQAAALPPYRPDRRPPASLTPRTLDGHGSPFKRRSR